MEVENIRGAISDEEFGSASVDADHTAPREHEVQIGNQTLKSPVPKDVLITVREYIGEKTESWLSFTQVIELARLIK